MRFKPLPVLTVLTVFALAVLLQFGNWQWRRFDEKRQAQATPAEIVTLGPIVDSPGGAVFLYGLLKGKQGWRIIRAVRIGAAPHIETVLVDTGFVAGLETPDLLATERTKPAALAPGRSLTGTWHKPTPPGPFAPRPDPAQLAVYAWDIPFMIAALDLATPRAEVFLLPYDGQDGSGGLNPFAAHADPLPPERHLGYALTWWGLAMALIAVYLAFHVRAGRLTLRLRS